MVKPSGKCSDITNARAFMQPRASTKSHLGCPVTKKSKHFNSPDATNMKLQALPTGKGLVNFK
jgi:hypothetical protein